MHFIREKNINPLVSENEIESLKKYKDVYENHLNMIEINDFQDYYNTCLNPNISKEEKTVFISAAALSDYIPNKNSGKISSKEENLNISLSKTPKVIQEIKKNNPLKSRKIIPYSLLWVLNYFLAKIILFTI